jgi:hypothetical protein
MTVFKNTALASYHGDKYVCFLVRISVPLLIFCSRSGHDNFEVRARSFSILFVILSLDDYSPRKAQKRSVRLPSHLAFDR